MGFEAHCRTDRTKTDIGVAIESRLFLYLFIECACRVGGEFKYTNIDLLPIRGTISFQNLKKRWNNRTVVGDRGLTIFIEYRAVSILVIVVTTIKDN